MQVSTPLPGLDADIRGVGLAGPFGLPGEPDYPDDLYAAMSAFTGSRAARPLIAEMVSIAAAVMTAILAERTSPGDLLGGDLALHGRRDGPAAAALPADGQMCTLFAVDIAGFTRPDRDDDIRRYLHEELYDFLPKAFDDSGIPWAECFCEDRGDGALIVVPPGISAKGIIDPLPERLRTRIRRHNHVSCAAAGMQLRAATHIGPVEHDGHGFVGSDINLLFRMLEARPVKRMLAGSAAELALIVSDFVYRGLVCRYPSLVQPEIFRTARFQVKHTRFRAWTYLPGAAYPG